MLLQKTFHRICIYGETINEPRFEPFKVMWLQIFGTAIMVVASREIHAPEIVVLQRTTGSSSIQSILWTDEPSAHVAVSAMKAGASDFIEMSSKRSLELLLQRIDELLSLAAADSLSNRRICPNPRELDFVAHAATSREVLSRALSIACSQNSIAVLLGPRGSGRSTLGKWIHAQRPFSASYHEIDTTLWDQRTEKLFDGSDTLLSCSSTVLLEHCELTATDILEAAERWIAPSNPTDAQLLVGTYCPETAEAWRRLTGAEILEIPPLAERIEDFFPLISLFQRAVDKKYLAQAIEFDSALIKILQSFQWPGNIKQLKSSLTDALSFPAEQFDSILPSLSMSAQEVSALSVAQRMFLRTVLWNNERWERYAQSRPVSVSVMACRKAVHDAAGNLRIAAAKLGTSIQDVRAKLDSSIEGPR